MWLGIGMLLGLFQALREASHHDHEQEADDSDNEREYRVSLRCADARGVHPVGPRPEHP